MPDPLLCTRCGSDAVIPRVRVIDRGDSNTCQDLEVEVQRRPNAVLFKRGDVHRFQRRSAVPAGMRSSLCRRNPDVAAKLERLTVRCY